MSQLSAILACQTWISELCWLILPLPTQRTQECYSHQWSQPSNVNWKTLREPREQKNIYVNMQNSGLHTWDNFNTHRLIHLPIQRRMLNSLTWHMVSWLNNNLWCSNCMWAKQRLFKCVWGVGGKGGGQRGIMYDYIYKSSKKKKRLNSKKQI